MNYTTAVFLINDDVRAIACTYEEGDKAARSIFKTFDKTIRKDDLVIIPTDTRHKMTVVKVVETDVDIDLDSAVPVAWIIGKVDAEAYKSTLALEEEAVETIKAAEKKKKRDEMRSAVFAHREEMLNGLALTKLETPVALPGAGPSE
jgi:hypothetical protein